jgi:hypothetical protein
MDSLKRGFSFLKQSWQMALSDRDLLKPSLYALVAGFIVTILGTIPILSATFLLGENPIGRVIIYVSGAFLIFAQYAVGYIFSAMTIYLIYGFLSEGDGRMDRAWGIVRRDFFDILSLALASTLVQLLKRAVQGKGRSGARNFLAGLLDTIWTQAAYLVLPAMVIEDISLRQGLRRATDIVRRNLLLVGVSAIGVKAITNLIGFVLGATGIGLGLGVGLGLVSLTSAAPAGIFAGISLGILIASAFILAAVVISSYTATAYHTCLYLWARDVERAQLAGLDGETVPAPAPLAAVLDRGGLVHQLV